MFDNLYWLGTRQHSSWALKTSAGLIIIDTNFAWATQPEILDGMAKLKLNPKDIKYVILSHAHGDHDQGVATLQSKFGARIVMGGPDWEATLKRAPDVAGGVPTRGPNDISVGPEGTKVTLGDTTVDIVFTPGHSVGTLSYVFPVKDKGKTVMVAYSGGTLTGAFGNDGKRWDEYIDSQKRIAQAAAAAGASVILSNHSEYDNAYTKARLVAVKREVGEENPFIMGAAKRAELFHGDGGMRHRVQAAQRREIGEERPAKPGKSIQWIDLSDERRSGARPSATRGRHTASQSERPNGRWRTPERSATLCKTNKGDL